MLFAGSVDGVYRIEGAREPGATEAERVLAADEVYGLRQFDTPVGLFATTTSGLYLSPDGRRWTGVSLPGEGVYSVAAGGAGDSLYAGTRPARLFAADSSAGLPTDAAAWDEVDGFAQLRARTDWAIPRHDGLAQLRSIRTDRAEPDRIVAGVEVGGVYVSDDGGQTWTARTIDGFDEPHTDDIHHLALADAETIVASTGSGLYRSTDVGRTWTRLDTAHSQRYFREAFVHDGTIFAGGAPRHPATWEEEADHALFASRDGETLERESSPTTDEVAVGWCAIGDDVVTVTHRGTLLRGRRGEWTVAGSVPTPGRDRVQCVPLAWHAP